MWVSGSNDPEKLQVYPVAPDAFFLMQETWAEQGFRGLALIRSDDSIDPDHFLPVAFEAMRAQSLPEGWLADHVELDDFRQGIKEK